MESKNFCNLRKSSSLQCSVRKAMNGVSSTKTIVLTIRGERMGCNHTRKRPDRSKERYFWEMILVGRFFALITDKAIRCGSFER